MAVVSCINLFTQQQLLIFTLNSCLFSKDHKMALMQMETVEDAIEALIVMHNYKLADNAHLRVSFSKSGI